MGKGPNFDTTLSHRNIPIDSAVAPIWQKTPFKGGQSKPNTKERPFGRKDILTQYYSLNCVYLIIAFSVIVIVVSKLRFIP